MGSVSTKTAPRARSALGLAFICAALAGCAVSPKPLTPEEIAQRVASDRMMMYANQEPVSGALSFSDVVARVMKYNLDFRLRMMEATLAQSRLDVGNWDMWPRLMANAGWLTRNNDSGGRSVDIATGLPSPTNSTSQERTRTVGGLEFSWNLLDFGVSYYRARALADQAMIAEERKRKVMQNLMQDSRIAYWRALGAQRLSDNISDLMNRGNIALARARQIEQQGLLPQAQALAYQRALLDSTTLLQIRRQDLEIAKAELAALMNLPPSSEFRLVDVEEPNLPPLPANLDKLEDLAMKQRPELREEDYRRRISAADTRRAIVSAMPNLSFNLGYQYDSNKYLYNNSWAEAGLRFSSDLIRLISIGSIKRAGEAQLSVDDTRRLAQAMAILTQVRVAALRYNLSRDELKTMSASAQVDQRLANFARASASSRVDSELELIRTEARALLSAYQRQIAYANAQASWGRLYNSLGLDLTPGETEFDLEKLSGLVGTSMRAWHQGVFGRPQQASARSVMNDLRLVIDGVAGESRNDVRDGLVAALNDKGIKVTNDESAPWALHVTAAVNKRSGRHLPVGTWDLVMTSRDGRSVGRANYTGELPYRVTGNALRELSRNAISAYADFITDRLQVGSAPITASVSQ
ncbi:MAG: TolC family protein [Burkholderiaceae bacterium]